jgi:hypothetical protein
VRGNHRQILKAILKITVEEKKEIHASLKGK